MKTVRRFLVGMVAVLAVLTATTTAPAGADVVFTGTIGASDPQTMPVVFISTPNCTGQGAALVGYREHLVAPGESGTFTFTLEETGSDLSLYVMADGWDPAAAFPSCIAGSNTDPNTLTVSLDAYTRYYVVVFDDTFDQLGGSYTLTVEGPGLNPPLTRPDLPIGTPTTEPTTTTTAPATTTTQVTTTTTYVPPPTTAPVTTTTTRPVTTTTVRPGTVPTAPAARPLSGAPGYTG